MKKAWQGYSFLKFSEGGMLVEDVVRLAHNAGAEQVLRRGSSYIGHTAVDVLATKRQHERFERKLWGGR